MLPQVVLSSGRKSLVCKDRLSLLKFNLISARAKYEVINMKAKGLILVLVIGVGIGWGIASYQDRRALEKIQQTWTPEFRDLVMQSVAIGKTMTKDERQELLKSAVETGSKLVTDLNSQAYGKAQHSFLMKKWIENGNVDDALSYSEACLERFVEKYDRGDFKDDINEEQAGRLVQAIKSATANESLEDRKKGSLNNDVP